MSEPQPIRRPNRFMRVVYLLLGLLMLATGIVGIFVPLMPTTIFLILAAWCFSRSSVRLERWLLNHRVLGPTILAWRRHGAIPVKAKAMACTGMAIGFVAFWLTAHPAPWLVVVVALTLALCATYVLTRPSGPSSVN